MSKPSYIVFYGNQVYGEYNRWTQFSQIHVGSEVYNGAVFFNTINRCWYNLDGTPVLLEDVPKTLRMLALVLNL